MKKTDKGIQIFCPLRKKWCVNSPEEWVRQHCIQLLKLRYNYNFVNMIAEYPVVINGLHQRADILVMKHHKPYILVECKKPGIDINQSVLDQALRYIQKLKCPFLYLSNGNQQLFMKMNYEKQSVEMIQELPNND